MTKELEDNFYEKRIKNIEKGQSYLNSNGFFRSKSNLFEDIQRFISVSYTHLTLPTIYSV